MDVLAGDILLYPLKCSEAFSLISVEKLLSLMCFSMCQSVFCADWKGKDKALLYDGCF